MDVSCYSTGPKVSRWNDYRKPVTDRDGTGGGVGRTGLSRRHGLLAVLVLADRSGVAEGFAGGVRAHRLPAVRNSVPGRSMTTASDGLRGGGQEAGRRILLRPRSSTLATDHESSERVLTKEPNGNDEKNPEINRAAAGISRLSDGGTDEREADTVGMGQRGDSDTEVENQAPATRVGVISRPKHHVKVMGFPALNSYKTVDADAVRHSVMHYMKTPKVLTASQFLNLGMASSRHCEIQLVLKICEAARSLGVTMDVRFMTNLVNAAAKAQRWMMASQLLMLMRSYGIEPNHITFTSILSEMSKTKQHHMAAEMVRTEGLGKSLFAYNALISGCAKSRGYDRALGYFNDMLKARVQPDAMTFSSIIATTRDGTEKSVERAFEALELMKQYGVKPTTYCMNSVMAVSVLARRPNTALDLFKEMKRDGIPRDVVSFNTAIKACDSLGEAGAAVRLLRQAREESIVPDTFSYNSVISALGHKSMWEEALQTFEEMPEAGVEQNMMTYNTVIAACVRAEHPAEALEVFRQMKEKQVNQDQYSYAGALHACLQLRDVETSRELVKEAERSGMPVNAEGYATAIRTCARCGESDQAVALYVASLAHSVIPTKVTYTCLLEAFAATKSAERANWVLDEMVEMQVAIEKGHLELVMNSCTDETEIALRALRINEELGSQSAESLYVAGLEVCITAGSDQGANEVVKRMSAVGLQPDIDQERRMIQSCQPDFPTKSERRRLQYEASQGAGSEQWER